MDMDEKVSRLQAMFPSIEGDVIAVVLNESEHNSKSIIVRVHDNIIADYYGVYDIL